MKKICGFMLAALLVTSAAMAADSGEKRKQEERLQNSGQVMSEILNMPDSIPTDLLNHAKCVVVIPNVVKAAFVVGGEYGKGAMVCRSGPNFSGPWGAPAMIGLDGGSVGFQAGGEATDFVLLLMNDRAAGSLLDSKVTVGGDASAAAGPVGRNASADTDAYMRAEILTYSRSRGLFAGVSLQGASLHPDKVGNEALYGREMRAREIVRGGEATAPEASHMLLHLLEKTSPVLATKSE